MKPLVIALIAALSGFGTAASAQPDGALLQAELRPGWRLANGDHMAALHLKLAPGWKTYWRAPGDAGIPPLFSWRGSRNAKTVAVSWPTPQVFYQSGMRSVGYSPDVVLPLRIAAEQVGRDIRLKGEVQLGICKDICIPETLKLEAMLPAAVSKVDPVIAAALSSVPFSAQEAAVRSVRCTIGKDDGAMTLRAEIDMPTQGDMVAVIETDNPMIWVAEPATSRSGGRIVAETRMMHMDGSAFALDRSGVRITLLGKGQAVDIRGCGS